MKPHTHAKLMAQYAEDALKSEEPWRGWQYFSNEACRDCYGHPGWYSHIQYRRKPPTVTILGHTLPKPETEAPSNGTLVYLPTPGKIPGFCVAVRWGQYPSSETHWLRCGLVHLKQEHAVMWSEIFINLGRDAFNGNTEDPCF